MSRADAVRLIVVASTVAALYLSCGRPEPDSVVLEVVPQPDIAGADIKVREQLTESRRRLDEILAAWDGKDPSLGAAFGEMGLVYHGYDLLQPAESCYRNARTLEPRRRDWAYLLGLVLQRRGRFDEAAGALEAALELQPDDAPALLHFAQVEQNRNRLSEAKTFFEKALQREPDCHAARFGLAEIAQSRGDLSEAAALFQAVLRDQPEAAQVHYPLAQVLRRLGRTDEAQVHLQRVSDRTLKVGGRAGCPDPLGLRLAELRTGSAAAVRRGLQLGLAGGGSEEIELLRQAVDAHPEDPKTRLRLGTLLLRRGDLDGARHELEEAARLQSGNPEIHSSLGVLFMQMDRSDVAEERFRKALEINPGSSHYQLQLASAVERQGDCDEAIDLLGRVLDTQPTHPQALLQRGRCLARAGRVPEAARDMALLLDSHPPADPAHYLRLASMLLSLGEEETAVRHFVLISESRAPAEVRAQAHILIGRVQLQRGDATAADRSFRTASALDPQLPQPPAKADG